MLQLPLTERTTFVLARPHYPENLGAAVRAAKTMGVTQIALVKPGRLARPEHEMAYKMAVKSWDVLAATRTFETVESATQGIDLVFGTTSHRGVSGVLTARDAARVALDHVVAGGSVAVIFGNEKTGLSEAERAPCTKMLRIPMAADQPSINLAQACQIVAYELYVTALEQRALDRARGTEAR